MRREYLLAPMLLWACEQDPNEPEPPGGDAAELDGMRADVAVDAALPDFNFPDAETDPCVPRVLDDAPDRLRLVGINDELFAWETESAGSLWQVARGGWRLEIPLYVVFAGQQKLWLWIEETFTPILPSGEVGQPVNLDLGDITLRDFHEEGDGRLLVAGNTGAFDSADEGVLAAYTLQGRAPVWRFADEGFDGTRSLFDEVLVGSDGHIYVRGTFFPSADPQATLLMSFTGDGEELTYEVSFPDEVNAVSLAESAGRVYVFGDRNGDPVVVPFDDVGGVAIGPPIPPGFDHSIPHAFWPLPDGWLMVMDLWGSEGSEPYSATWVVRTDAEGAIVWDRQYADPELLVSDWQGAALAGGQLHLLTRVETFERPDRQVALDLDGQCLVAPRLVFLRDPAVGEARGGRQDFAD